MTVSTDSQGGDAGRLQQMTDARGFIAKTDYDAFGRTARTVEAFMDFVPSAGDDRTTEFTYDGSHHVLTRAAVLPGGAPQTTEYVYNVTGPAVYTRELLSQVKHPDKITGVPSTTPSGQESLNQNALGQKTSYTDRNGTAHSYSYDVLGRLVSETLTAVGIDVDDTVRTLQAAYDEAGRAFLFTSRNDMGDPVNQVKREYNGLGQLVKEFQAPLGVVDGTTKWVQYDYSEMTGGVNHSRLTQMIVSVR